MKYIKNKIYFTYNTINIIKPNYFEIEKDIYLFFDIFYKNNLIYLICPIYYEEHANIKIYNKNILLEVNKNIIKKIQKMRQYK